jgi:glyoxylase I family protein
MSLQGVSHISFTVSDLQRSREWYRDVLGWESAMDGRSDTTSFSYGALPDGTTLVLRTHDDPISGDFEERRRGLDHLSFAVTEAEDVTALEGRLGLAGTTFTPAQHLPFGQVLAFRDPDNIALEVFYVPSA